MAMLIGVVAAGTALAMAELPSALTGDRVSPIVAISNEFVDRFASSLKDVAVTLFGEQDKVALVVGVVVVALVIGGLLGVVARRNLWLAAAGFGGFGVLGALAMAADPQVTSTLAVASALAGACSGIAVLAGLFRLDREPERAQETWGPGDDPTVKTPDRRRVLVAAGATGVAAVALGAFGRTVRTRSTVAAERAQLVLPRPARTGPTATGQPTGIEGHSRYLTPNDEFFRIDTALGTPQVEAAGWSLSVHGMVDRELDLSFDDLLAMELIEETVTLSCVSNEVGGRLVGNARWLGVPLAAILDLAGVQEGATQVVGRSVDDFTVGFPTEVGLDGRIAMVAVGMNGEPLPPAHGYPARLVVAGLYGYVSATKWLREIELTTWEGFDAYWVPRGWAKEGPIKIQSRIDVPRRGAQLSEGVHAVAGVAWAPTDGVSAVEVQIDDGPWRQAELEDAASGSTWRQWHLRWDAPPGDHTIRVRARRSDGELQETAEQPPRPDGATGLHTISVRVEPV
jgi:DMSO/TMAO reductase YedYZ molybdopterin-dependent catalytic subunit